MTMGIRKCIKEDIVSVGAFYDQVVAWLDAHVNYPKWIYKIYASITFPMGFGVPDHLSPA